MKPLKKKWRNITILIAFMTPFIFFSVKQKHWEKRNSPVVIWQDLILPLQSSWHNSLHFVSETFSYYIWLINVAKENKELLKKQALLEARILDYKSQEIELKRLRRLLEFTDRYEREI